MKKIFIVIKVMILIFIIILFIFNFSFAKVEGDSMNPKLSNNDIILYKKNLKEIKRFDIIIVKVNDDLLIKRVIGLSGEKIEYIDNTLYVNGTIVNEPFQKSITKDFCIDDISGDNIIPDNKLLVLGDNRLYSTDSRTFGLIDISDIYGIMLMKIF